MHFMLYIHGLDRLCVLDLLQCPTSPLFKLPVCSTTQQIVVGPCAISLADDDENEAYPDPAA
jgi:hypothetical protein